MKAPFFAIWVLLNAASAGFAQQHSIPLPVTDPCEIPGYLVYGESKLQHAAKAVKKDKKLNILVLGSGSSVLPGADGAAKAYPARLEATLQKRFPDVAVKVATVAKSRLTASNMIENLDKLLLDQKPDLVVWQTGTVDAMRGVDPEDFRVAVDEGIDTLQQAGVDVVLMNMQYSPRTETMIQLGSYADNMRVVARDRDVPLFDRLEIMRYWNDNGNIDLNVATKDTNTAQQVHDCIGRALASLITETADLDAVKPKPGQ